MSITMKSTKEVIFNALQEAEVKIKELRNAKYDPSAEKESKEKQEVITAAEKSIGDASLIQKISLITTDLQNQLKALTDSHELASGELVNINEAIKIKRAELKDLYAIETGIDTLAATVQAQSDRRIVYQEEQQEQLENHKAILGKVLEDIKLARTTHDTTIKQLEEELRVKKSRLTEEFDYELARDKKVRTNAMLDEVNRISNEMEEVSYQLDLREKELESRESKVAELEDKVAELPKAIELAAIKATNALKSTLTAQHELEIAKLKAIFESKIEILDHKSQMLEETLHTERAAHQDTSTKLETAYSRMEKVATASVEGSRTEETVNRILSTINDKK